MQDATRPAWQRERLLEALDAHSRGLVEPPIVRKRTELPPPEPVTDGNQSMTFAISTEDVDRHGDVIVTGGWRLDHYARNPVFLWAHDYARPVIGRAARVWKGGHELWAQMEWAPTDFAQEVAMLYNQGYQRGVSVGFKPLRYEQRRDEKTGAFLGIRFLEQELLEVSAVPVPANRNALRKALDTAPRVAEYLRRSDPADGLSQDQLAEVLSLLRGLRW